MKWGSIGKAFALVGLAVVVIALCACPVPVPVVMALVCVAVYACYAAAQILRDNTAPLLQPDPRATQLVGGGISRPHAKDSLYV